VSDNEGRKESLDWFARTDRGHNSSERAGNRAAATKADIIVIMGDDIGMWNIGSYHRGLMAGAPPNLDQLATEGMLFTDYYAEGSCTAGRTNFIIGELPIRTGMIVGQAGSQPGARFKLGEVKAEIEKKIASLAAQ
jgi:arylsulfatase A-like enzyme